MKELTVILKDSERTLRTKSLEYEDFTMSLTDPLILDRIQIAKKDFTGEPEDITISVKMVIQ